jgi:magnesium transporter
MAVVAGEQNDVVRRISAWAAIITVPTFIASFYGMNTYMPELQWHGMYIVVLAIMLVAGIGLYASFKRAHWL